MYQCIFGDVIRGQLRKTDNSIYDYECCNMEIMDRQILKLFLTKNEEKFGSKMRGNRIRLYMLYFNRKLTK